MPKKAEKHYHDHQQSASNVGRLGKKASVTPDQEYKHGERDQAENNATAMRHKGIQNRREQRERSVIEEGIPGTH